MIGAAIQGAANLVGGLVDSAFAERQQRQQQQHDKDMAAINNAYQVEQWNRENAYNDPSAVRARYEAAGISPQQAFGAGAANGAGIAGGLSSSPGSASNIMYDTDFGSVGSGLASAINQSQLIDSQNKLANAQANKADEESRSLKFKTDVLDPIQAQIAVLERESKGISVEMQKVDKQFQPILKRLEVTAKEQSISNMIADMNKIYQDIEESKSKTALNKEEQKYYKQLTDESYEKTQLIVQQYISKAIENYVDEHSKQFMIDARKFTSLLTKYQGMDAKVKFVANNTYLRKMMRAQLSDIYMGIGLKEAQIANIIDRFSLDEWIALNELNIGEYNAKTNRMEYHRKDVYDKNHWSWTKREKAIDVLMKGIDALFFVGTAGMRLPGAKVK